MSSTRDFLVLVRAGDRSLHPQWLIPDRTWDIAVSYYGNHIDRYIDQYDYLHLFKGSKWQGITDFLIKEVDLIKKYKFIWMPDDDLLCHGEIVNAFFEYCTGSDFTILQPALTDYSYVSHPITIQNKACLLRQTNFVEIMAPCFNLKTFHHFSDTLSENSSGFGFEWLWATIAQRENIFRFGIVDATPVFHTRPVGSAGHGGSTSKPHDEMHALFARHGISRSEPAVIAYAPRPPA